MLSKIDDITLIDPQRELDKGAEKAEVYQPILLEAQWQTPVKESVEIIKKATIRNYDRDIFKPKL